MPATPDLVPNQFGDAELSAEEAYAACGPAAAVAFARHYGRKPTLKEALKLAKQYGWTAGGGMNGVGNQKRLLDAMGLPSTLDTAPTEARITQVAARGEPVTISTALHYYVADDYDPKTGQLHVGNSGRARKGGGDWMTLQQISQQDGGINGALFIQAADTSGGNMAGSQGVSRSQQTFDDVVAKKGDPVSVVDITKQVDDPDVPGLKVTPNATKRYTFRDGSYIDVRSEADSPDGSRATDITVVGGTALASTSKTPGAAAAPTTIERNGTTYIWDAEHKRYAPAPGIPAGKPKEPAKPNNKQVVTRDGKSYVYDPDTNTFTPATGLPDEKPKVTTHVIGKRIYTVDDQGNVVSTTDARTATDVQAEGLGIQKDQQGLTKGALDIQKTQRDLLPAQQQIIQGQLETIKYVQGMLERGEIEPSQADAYITASRAAADAALQGTTPFALKKAEDDAKREREKMGVDILNTRIQSGSSLASSLTSAALGAAQHAMFRPGQTSLGVDPMAAAFGYSQQINQAAQADPATAALLQGATVPPQRPAAPLPAGL